MVPDTGRLEMRYLNPDSQAAADLDRLTEGVGHAVGLVADVAGVKTVGRL
jgi:hypothetical protein